MNGWKKQSPHSTRKNNNKPLGGGARKEKMKVEVKDKAVKDQRRAFTLGYAAATSDIVNKLVDMPKEHGGEILFQRDVYGEEFKEFVKPEEVSKRAMALTELIN